MAPQPVRARDLPPGYTEWLAPAALRHAIACLWAQVTPDAGRDRDGLVLPDACSDLIWEQGRGAFVAGPDTGPVRTVMKAGTVVIGVRFRPSAGGPVLGVPLSELRDQRVDLDDLRRRDARRLPGTLDPDTAAKRALDLAASLVADADPDDDRTARHHGPDRAGVRAGHVRAAALLPDQVAARIGQHQACPVAAVRVDLRPQARHGVPQPGRGRPLGIPGRQGSHRAGPRWPQANHSGRRGIHLASMPRRWPFRSIQDGPAVL